MSRFSRTSIPLLCLSTGRRVPVPVGPWRRPPGTGGSQKLLTNEELFAVPSEISGREVFNERY